MPKSEVVAALSTCCELSPDSPRAEQMARDKGLVAGQFIFSKDEPKRILGTVYFQDGRLARITRPLGDEAYAPWNDDAVGLARTLYRALAPTTGESERTVIVSVRHERATNAETEVLRLTFPDGRGIQLNLIKMDRPLPEIDARDQATLDEFLESPRR